MLTTQTASTQQLRLLLSLYTRLGATPPTPDQLATMTAGEATDTIDRLRGVDVSRIDSTLETVAKLRAAKGGRA
jgi:hypothetical protein